MEELNESVIKKTLPYDPLAEKSVIGCMLLDRDSLEYAGELLSKDDFYEKQYGFVFDALIELNSAGKPVDVVTLSSHLREKDLPEEIYSLDFIQDIMTLSISILNFKEYAQIVKNKSLLRSLIHETETITNTCYSQTGTVDDIFKDAEKRIFDIVQRRNTGEYVPISKIVENTMERFQKIQDRGSRITGIPTGFVDLDSRLSGLQNSDLILIAARPAMGKTAFALNIAHHIAVKNNYTTAIFSLEMPKEQLVNRLLSVDSMVPAEKIRDASFEDNEIINILESASKISSSKLIVDDTSSISIDQLRSKCRKYKLEYDLKLIIIDYLQLMSSGRRADSRQHEVSDISRALKLLAREIDVPVIALSQLSRDVEKREGKPKLSDLRESGAIEQDADVVMFLYRDKEQADDVTEIIIAKQRNGPIGSVFLKWISQCTKFANLEQ